MIRRKFAFLIHLRNDVPADLGLYWKPLGRIPPRACEWALRSLPIPPIRWARVSLRSHPEETAGWLITVPLSGRQMLSLPRDFVQAKIDRAIDSAIELGAETVGLGALTAPVTRGGHTLAKRTDISVTNGNAFTAVMTYEAILRLLDDCAAPDPEIAVVGATGSVGRCVVQLLAEERAASRLLLVARNKGRLQRLADSLEDSEVDARISTRMDSVRKADLVVLLTSSSEHLLWPEHLKEGAVVLDDTQPRNTSPSLPEERPDVTLLDGGLVDVPGMRLHGGGLGLQRGQTFACMAETMLLALEGHAEHFSVGSPTLEQAKYIRGLASKHSEHGFTLAPFHSFGRPAESRAMAEAL